MEWQSTTWDGTLTVGSVQMHCPAWVTYDVHQLWAGPAKRGENLKIPGRRRGRLAMPKYEDETTFLFPMEIAGDVDRLGAPWADFRDGYRRNVAYLRQYVSGATGGDGTRLVSLSTPAGGPTLTGAAHVSIEMGEQLQGVWRAILTLEFPDGGVG